MGDPDLTAQAQAFLAGFRSAVLATAAPDGAPDASYAPFVRLDDGAFHVYVSGLAAHTRNLAATGRASVLLIEPEKAAAEIFARRRLTFGCRAEPVARASPRWDRVLDLFAAKFGAVVDLVRPLEDFVLVRLAPESALFVRGFANARRLGGEELAALGEVNDLELLDGR
jgi:putative heme iron utilization protein